jgi:hypothetical protein
MYDENFKLTLHVVYYAIYSYGKMMHQRLPSKAINSF